VVARRVPDDAEEPRTEALRLTQARKPAKRLEERLLDDVVDLGRADARGAGDGVRLALMAQDERVEGLGSLLECLSNERGVGSSEREERAHDLASPPS
jgi:hypothetical protein